MIFLDKIIAVGRFSVAVERNLKKVRKRERDSIMSSDFYQVFEINFLVLLVGFVVTIGFRKYS
jgi:hypothetical protein